MNYDPKKWHQEEEKIDQPIRLQYFLWLINFSRYLGISFWKSWLLISYAFHLYVLLVFWVSDRKSIFFGDLLLSQKRAWSTSPQKVNYLVLSKILLCTKYLFTFYKTLLITLVCFVTINQKFPKTFIAIRENDGRCSLFVLTLGRFTT